MGLTPRIWQVYGRCAQSFDLPRCGSLISTMTAVPDRARAARTGGARGRRVLKESPQARPAAPRLSQMSGFARS